MLESQFGCEFIDKLIYSLQGYYKSCCFPLKLSHIYKNNIDIGTISLFFLCSYNRITALLLSILGQFLCHVIASVYSF